MRSGQEIGSHFSYWGNKKPHCGVISSNFTMGLDGTNLTQCPKPEISPENGGSNISLGSPELTVGS